MDEALRMNFCDVGNRTVSQINSSNLISSNLIYYIKHY